MYTEVSKIIEGGLLGDREKVFNYANVLANSVEEAGDIAFAKKIRNLLNNKKYSMASLDSLTSKPVDGESRMEMVDVSMPTIDKNYLVIDKYIEEEIEEFIKCYESRDALISAGLDISNTLLFYGPPGCGKTTLAQYISVKTQLPLVTARLDGLISSLLGSTAKNIRKIFDFASKRECILFLDEFDVIAKVRDDKNETGELKRVVNSLIQNIDMFNPNSIIIAATNHHELLDPAIWRRFSRVLTLTQPKLDEVNSLITKFMMSMNNTFISNEKKLLQISKAMLGLSHSDIKNIINNSIKNAIINLREEVTVYDVLKEIYLFRYHSITEEEDFLSFLLINKMTHRELESLGFSLRKVQNLSKTVR